MKTKLKILLCAILVIAAILPALFSCASKDEGNADKKDGEIQNEAENEAPAEDEKDTKLPFEPTIIDLGGRDFTFADCGWGAETTSEQRDVLAEEQNGENINDAVY
ncbi:MAG: hypothetical protein FWH48_11580, partial [Oscillospiraceae bacterium]|nr:hypothetical protein [Oscillospiraceae bacterium]